MSCMLVSQQLVDRVARVTGLMASNADKIAEDLHHCEVGTQSIHQIHSMGRAAPFSTLMQGV